MKIEMPSKLALAFERRRMMLGRAFFRLHTKITGNAKPSSYPYISNDSFRALADYRFDYDETFDPKNVRPGDLVFVNGNKLVEFIGTLHKDITATYVLFAANDDTNISDEIAALLDTKIYKLYAQDVICEHPKVIPVPMGLENWRIYSNGIPSTYTKLRKQIEKHPPQRKNRIFFKFNIRTNPKERTEALTYLEQCPLADTTEYKLPPIIHTKLLPTYKFLASPPGHTIESGKNWEALYLKTIPIVKNFAAMRYFVSLGLPLWIIKDWKELDGLTEKDLERIYNEKIAAAKWDALFMDYWIKRIQADQEYIRKNNL